MSDWSELDEQTKTDLVEWFNVRKPHYFDLQRLARLFKKGLFRAWDCPECGNRVHVGEPEDWSHFQGVCGADFCSYPGNLERYSEEYNARLCDHCRMYCFGEHENNPERLDVGPA